MKSVEDQAEPFGDAIAKCRPHLKGLKIRNHGVLKAMDVEFCEGINMITGSGGSGKTFIVKAIDMVYSQKTEVIKRFERGSNDEPITKEGIIEGEFYNGVESEITWIDSSYLSGEISASTDKDMKDLSIGERTELFFNHIMGEVGPMELILSDNTLAWLPPMRAEKIIRRFHEVGCQVIAVRRYLDDMDLPEGTRIIELDYDMDSMTGFIKATKIM